MFSLKNILAVLIIGGALYQIFKDQLTLEAIAGVAVGAVGIMLALDQVYPDSNVVKVQKIGMNPDACALQQVMRKLFTEHAIRTKVFLNSFMDNHLSKHINGQLLQENQNKIGNVLREVVGNTKADVLTGLLLGHVAAIRYFLGAIYANNQVRVKEAIEGVYTNGDQVAQAFSSINVSKLPLHTMQRMFKEQNEYVISMGLARAEQNWKRDAQIYEHYYEQILQMADTITRALL